MVSYIKNLLKQLPFYGKTIKPRIKKFPDAKLLSELPFLKNLKKPKLNNYLAKNYYKNKHFINSL